MFVLNYRTSVRLPLFYYVEGFKELIAVLGTNGFGDSVVLSFIFGNVYFLLMVDALYLFSILTL
jgi:hypothetical protein